MALTFPHFIRVNAILPVAHAMSLFFILDCLLLQIPSYIKAME